MSIQISDPLSLLPYQSGLLAPPLREEAAKGQNPVATPQRAVVLGEPVPIIFCRRVSNDGGVFVSPGATEGRYINDASTNQLTVNLQLVLSEGNLPQLQLRDLYQRNCRVGTWTQTYNRRAGTWLPGNFIVPVASKQFWNCPLYCGTSGRYNNLTTLSYTNNHTDGDDSWDKQVHAFVRNGIQVTRILDSTLGSSNNLIDLALYLIRQSSRLPESMIDLTAMTAAANFTNVNGFLYNGEFKESTNLEDWLQQISASFLLRLVDDKGKKGFKPRLPINNNYTIKTTAVSWVFGFTEDHILPGGFEIEHIPLSERKPICALVLWRQQPDSELGIVRSLEVRYNGEAPDGPYEQYDLSQFCTSENHAAKVGAFYVARRIFITHTLRIQVRPDAFNGTLVLGDIVRVRLRRETNEGVVSFHDYLYEVERIGRKISGIVELDLIHFPVDSQLRSVVALAVANATGSGYVLPTGRNDFTCNVNTSTDSIPDTGGNLNGLPDPGDFTHDIDPDTIGAGGSSGGIGGGIDGGGIGGGIGGGAINNPVDPLDEPLDPGITGDPIDGSTVSTQPVCAEAQVNWYKIPKNASTWDDQTQEVLDYSAKQLVYTETVTGGAPGSLILTTPDIDHIIYAEWRCADPSQPDGYGTPVPAGNTIPVEPDITQYQFARFVASSPTAFTTQWVAVGGPGDEPFLYLAGLRPISSGAFGNVSGSSNTPAGPGDTKAWRSTVSARAIGSTNGYGVGGVGGVPSAGLPIGTISLSSDSEVIQTGDWEFTNNTSTGPEITWSGRPDS
jgi:hypothetical protein